MKPQTHTVDSVQLVLRARSERKPLASIPPNLLPKDIASAYKLQELLVDQLLSNGHGTAIGYKVACTSKRIQDLMSVDEPFYGRLMSQSSFKDGANIPADKFFFRCMEAEFSFEIAHDLPDRAITIDELSDFIGAVLPSIEIVDSRYADWLKMEARAHIVDNACHGAWVEGKRFRDWHKIDLAKQRVKLFVNGKLTREGSGEAVLGNPLNVLVWLANALHRNGKQLKAGDLVSTGITTDVYFASAGEEVSADFGEIGQVKLSFSS
jgi:2-keto-4-pentenoate hydratase